MEVVATSSGVYFSVWANSVEDQGASAGQLVKWGLRVLKSEEKTRISPITKSPTNYYMGSDRKQLKQ